MREAYSVTPLFITRTSLPPTVSGPDRNALLEPLAASTTALPDPTQLFSADWMREVSGGLASAELLNCRLLVASDAVTVAQDAGMDGWLTERASPVARDAAAAGSARAGSATATISPTASSGAATSAEPSAAGRTVPGSPRRVDRVRACGETRD